MSSFLAMFLYFSSVIIYATIKRKRAITQSDFVIGGRSLGRWTTALAAHASDMSNWLFMAYPGMVFLKGGAHVWVAIGLLLMMWINWRMIAPKMRLETERTSTVTITGFFEEKLSKNWSSGRLITSISLFLFYTVYVAVALSGMGLLAEKLFPVSYSLGVVLAAGLILPYVLIGGYWTLAKMDLFQGIFLMGVILFVPIFITFDLGGVSALIDAVREKGGSFSLFSSTNSRGIIDSLFLLFGWGLGYFGQPHILTKFMGIKRPEEIVHSRRIGMSWQFLSLFGATIVGFVGIAVCPDLVDHEQVFVILTQYYFSPFIAALFLCAIIAAAINAVSSMLLVLSTTVTEDLYKRFLKPHATQREQLRMTRLASCASALLGMGVALGRTATLDQLVMYAWSGLGASFGPLVIAALYFPGFNATAAWLGMVIGGGTVALWPLFTLFWGWTIPPLMVAFPLALVSLYVACRQNRSASASI